MLLSGETIGVGITTRNRVFSLKTALEYFEQVSTLVDTFIIVDDASTDESFAQTRALVEASSFPITLRKPSNRLGISNAKNACLAPLRNHDHIFLFDDDIWPIKKGWEEYWITSNKQNNIGHSMWIVPFNNPMFTVTKENESIRYFKNCLGSLLYFSKDCINSIGGYDTRAQNVYGFEHAQMSQRANRAGFTGEFPYVSPRFCDEYIYSIDISFNNLGIQPPLGPVDISLFSSSVLPNEYGNAMQNSVIMSYPETHIPLVDPLGEY